MFEILTDSSILTSRINADLLRAQKTDAAIGQFFLPDMAAFVDGLAGRGEIGKRRVRLLVGTNADRHDTGRVLQDAARTDTARTTLEAQRFAGRGEMNRRVARLAENVRRTISRMAQSDEDARLLVRLADLLESGAWEARAFVREPLPTDLLLTDWGQNKGAVLQSGGGTIPLFSSGALPDGHAGFWQRSDEEAFRNALQTQFDRWWGDALPFQNPLTRELKHNWANLPASPYLVYLLVLTRLVADRITDGDTTADDEGAGDRAAGLPALTDFQQVAVQQALSILRQYNGVFVADVVGLGKTYIGTALLKRLALQGQRAVIFCPPALVPMWQDFNSVYGLAAEVVSTGKLMARNGEDLNQPKYQTADRQIVLIDESHRFRNQGTDAYEILSNYSRGRKCILLTATPYSLHAGDVYQQIRLFADDDLDLNLSPPRLVDYFRAVRRGEASLVDVLRPLLIRRTRRHIRQHYPNAFLRVATQGGEWETRKITFPTRRPPRVIRYDVEGVYSGPLYEQILQKLGRPAHEASNEAEEFGDMTYARYGLFRYVLPAFRVMEPYRDLKKIGSNVRGFIRVLLFKRLESSVEAFRRTVGVLQTVHENFLTALDAGMVPAGEAAQAVLQEWASGEDGEGFPDALRALENHRYEAQAFDVTRLRADVENDAKVLRELSVLLVPISPDVDSKLQTLRDLMGEIGREKVLIFTQYETTARYLYDNLRDLPGGVAFLSGQHRGAGRGFMQTVARFAPKANAAFVLPDAPPITLLIATDVLSEGLNLQDCSRIINYDLPWNPVRLIQRAGRVDRVGSEAETIALFNFLPERGVERVLHLEEVLQKRIREIQEFIGEDAAILHPDERVNEAELYAAFTQPLPDDADEDRMETAAGYTVDFTELEEQVRQLRRDQPDLMQAVADLPSGVRTGRAKNSDTSATASMVVYLAADDYEQLLLCDAFGQVRSVRSDDALLALACGPEEPTLALPPTHNGAIAACFARFEQEAAERAADRKTGPKLSAGQQYILRHFAPFVRSEQNGERRQHLAFVEQALRARLPDAALRELNLIRRQGLTGDGLRQRLEQAYHDLDLARYLVRSEDAASSSLSTRPAVRVICSAALL